MDSLSISYVDSSGGAEFWLNPYAFIAQEFENFSKGSFFDFEVSQKSTLVSRPGKQKGVRAYWLLNSAYKGRFTLAFRTGKNRIAGPEMPARQKLRLSPNLAIFCISGKPEFRTS